MPISRTAAASARHPWVVLAAWVLVVLGGVVATPVLFDRLSSQAGSIDDSEAARARDLLFHTEPRGESIYAVADGRAAQDAGLRSSVTAVAARLRATPGVAGVVTPYDRGAAPDPRGVARDGRAVAVLVTFAPTFEGFDAVRPAVDVLRTIDAPHVVVTGSRLQDDEMDAQAGNDLARAEVLSMPVVLVLLLILFGGFVAAGLPVLIALVGMVATLAALALASLVTDVSVYAVNIVTMLGLGLAVDYALLIVSRFREERAVAGDVAGAITRTYATAGRTVAFSGLTVAASLAGLLVFPDDFLRSMGLAGLSVVLLDLLAAVTLMPALLSLVGARIRPMARRDGRWFVHVARVVRRRRAVVVLLAGALLVLAVVPFLGVRYADPGATSLPHRSQARQFAELATRFEAAGQGADPVTAVIRGAVPPADLTRYVASLRALAGARTVSVRQGTPGLTVVDVVPDGESQGPAALRLVRTVRATPAPSPVLVAGDAAELRDYEDALLQRLPWALGIVTLVTFVLLFLFTGSVVVPLKAIVMNTLSLGACFGALVWVFQDGHLGGLVGTDALGSLSVTTPVLVFAIAFGLSMDYEVFLLGRIAETYRETGDNELAVERGLQRTGGIVTAAALLMAVVFAGFVAGGFSPVKQVGLGLLVAVVVDATLVRLLLVPAVMSLMGRANWWAPPVLRRLHARLGLPEGPAGITATCPVTPSASPAGPTRAGGAPSTRGGSPSETNSPTPQDA